MRGLSEEFIQDLKEGKLKEFLTKVKEDDTLCLEIRNDYINIYYRGGSLYRIGWTIGNVYDVFFDIKYCDRQKDKISRILPDDYEKWIDSIPILKSEMDYYFYKYPKLEREYQQLVSRENNRSTIANDTDYYIADIEYANSEVSCRFDLLGIKWLSTSASRKNASDIRLVFIEKKYGDSALTGEAGIKKHFEDLYRFVSDEGKLEAMSIDAETVFNQKVKLGLVSNISKIIKISKNKPEFILLLANHKPAKSGLKGELKSVISSEYYSDLKEKVDIKVAKSSCMGYGLYSNLMVDLEVFVDEI